MKFQNIIFLACLAALPLAGSEPEKEAGDGWADFYVPLVIVGEGWSQQIIINNTDSENSLVGELSFYTQAGEPWSVDLVGLGSTDSVFVTLRSHQMAIIETVVKDRPQQLGFAVLNSDCCTDHFAQTLFRKQATGRPDLMTSMPLSYRSLASLVVPFDNRGGKYAGVGVLNAEPCFDFSCGLAPLEYVFRDLNAQEIKRVRVDQRHFTLNWFSLSAEHPELAGRVGTVEVRSVGPRRVDFVGFSLQFTPNGAFTVVNPIER